MHSRLLLGTTFALAGALAMWSCAGGGGYMPASTTPSPTQPSTSTVTINIVGSSGNKAFTPNPIQAASSNMIVWKNSTGVLHHIVTDDGSFAGDIAPGASTAPLQLKSAAANYHCTIHSTMIGSINGSAAPDPPPCTTPGYC